MKEKEIQKYNYAISKFMGTRIECVSDNKYKGIFATENGETVVVSEGHYRFVESTLLIDISKFPWHHNSWNWLMPVLEEIQRLLHKTVITSDEEEDRCEIFCYSETEEDDYYISETGEDTLQATYKAIIEFIKWYNTQEVKNG